MKEKKQTPSEAGLLIAVLIISISVVLMIKSNFGITTLSSLPLILSITFPNISIASFSIALSFGTYNFIFQFAFLILLMLLIKKVDPRYALSMVASAAFAWLADTSALILAGLPDSIPFRAIYFLFGLSMLPLGISLSIKCRLPALPFDIIVRDLAKYRKWPTKWIKTVLDISCVTLTCIISFCFLGQLQAVGPGTIVAALCTGFLVDRWGRFLDKRFQFEPISKIGNLLAQR